MSVQLKVIVAACENMGIGKNNTLPWRLKNELAYFTRMTKTVADPSKTNAVIMGRLTWLSTPPMHRPLKDRINIVLSRKSTDAIDGAHYVVGSLNACIDLLQTSPLADQVESVWVIGGAGIYREVMELPICSKIYLTRIMANFECDTFFPSIPSNMYKKIKEADVPEEIQEENNIKYQYEVYSKIES